MADAEEGEGGGRGVEGWAGSGEGGPDFAYDAAVGRDVDGVGDDVDAVGEVGDFVAGGVCEEGGVDGGGVVGLAVAWEETLACIAEGNVTGE